MRSPRAQRATPPVRLTDSGIPRGACWRSQRIVRKCSGRCSRISARRSARRLVVGAADAGGVGDEWDAEFGGPAPGAAGGRKGFEEALAAVAHERR